MDQEKSKARTESRASSRIAQLVRECFGEMPSRRVVVARFYLLGALTAMCAAFVLIMAAYTWLALWMVK